MRRDFDVLKCPGTAARKGENKEQMEMQVESVAFQGDRMGAPACDRPVDLVHLARYTLGNRNLEREVLELFLTHSVLYLNRLKQAISDKEWQGAAHTIKGSARGIGAWKIAESATHAEHLQGEALERERSRAVAALERDIEAANSYIGSLLASA